MAGACVASVFLFILFAATIGRWHSVLAAEEDEQTENPMPRFDGRIVGGIELDITDVPYQVSLQRQNTHYCGGSIVNKKWILTAAHCTDGQQSQFLSVRVGSSTHGRDGIVVPVERFVKHPQFNASNIDYDFSLIKLKKPLTFTDSVQPIKLANLLTNIPVGALCLVTGWGNTQNVSESRNNLRGAEVPIVEHNQCFDAYRKYGGITPRMICAGYKAGGKDACQGDSGGPLVWRKRQYGIVSWGLGCAQANYPGIYSRVSVASFWIRKVIAGL